MMDIPRLTIYFGPPETNEQISLKVLPPKEEKPITCSLTPPFHLKQVQLVLRALNARQYPDYPDNERRLFRSTEDRIQLIQELRELGLWDDAAEAVAEDAHIRVGRSLGNALLSNKAVRDSLQCLYNLVSQVKPGEICLSFASEAKALAALPWEVAHHNSRPILLAGGTVLNCTRVIVFEQSLAPQQPIEEPLCILTVAPRAGVDEQGRAFEQLTRHRMRDMFSHSSTVKIEELPENTMDALYKRLENGSKVHVLDFFGHGVSTSEGGALLMDGAQGGHDRVSAYRLASLPNLPPLIVLYACQSAQVDVNEPLATIALALSEAGVRAVVAMQLTIRMEAVANLAAPTFYQKLASFKSVQQAIASVRQALYSVEQDGVSWYVPTLYLRQPDQLPFVLLKQAASYPPNPFMNEALTDATRFIGREAAVKSLIGSLKAMGSLSIVGSPGSGKTTLLKLIIAEKEIWLGPKPQVVWLPLQGKVKLTNAQLMLAQMLGGQKAKATHLFRLLRGRHTIILLDNLGQLDTGEQGLEVRLWLRQLLDDPYMTVQLIASSARPLDEIFKDDESPLYSPLHNIMHDRIELGAFTETESRLFITKALEETPFQLDDFSDLLTQLMLPRALRLACLARYKELCAAWSER